MGGTGHARPLEGRRVLVTRARNQAAELVASLESLGARVTISPTIRVVPPADRGPLLRAARDLSGFDWIVFGSTNAVDAFLDALADIGGRLAAPALTDFPAVCAVGSRTAQRLRDRGVTDVVVPSEFRAEAVVTALTQSKEMNGSRVLLPRSEIGREVIAEGLRAAGAAVTEVVAYRTVADTADDTAPDVRRMLAHRELDAVTFTSGSTVRHFVEMHGPETIGLLANTVVAVIGPVTAEAARELGVPVHVQPTTYTTAAMTEALAAYFAG